MRHLPKHFQQDKPTPQVRGRQDESKVAKALKGRVAINSGATFGQNDILTDYCEVENKLTDKKSFTLKADYLEDVRKKCSIKKIPLMRINFATTDKSYAVIPFEDFEMLIALIEKAK